MQRRSKVAIGVGVAGVVTMGVVFLYPLLSPAVGDGPDARQVEATVEFEYKHPERHTLTAAEKNFDEEPHFIEWARRYDGVDMSTKVMSKRGPHGWETRWRRELAEPEPVRRKDLVSIRVAATNAGVGDAFVRGAVRARLLYRARFTLPAGSTDGELVVESYQLVIELQIDDRTGYVDAYTGKVIKPLRSLEPT